jgi:hypothetical protein
MNDFTKEELKQLMYGLWCRAKIDGIIVNKILYDKLKSLVDNYCEHDYAIGEYVVLSILSGYPVIVMIIKQVNETTYFVKHESGIEFEIPKKLLRSIKWNKINNE